MLLPPKKNLTAFCLHALAFLCAVSIFMRDAGAVVLPWLDDPWKVEEKVAGFGAKSKPATCPPPPDLKEALNVDEVVVAVICNNPDAKIAYLSLLSQADSYGSAFAAYLPSVSASASISRSSSFGDSKSTSISRGSGIDASMTLYDFGQRELSIESAELGLIAAGYGYDSTLQGFLATGLQSYYSLLVAQNAVDIAKESLKFAEESLQAALVRYKLGMVALADKLQADVSHSQAKLGVQQSEVALVTAQAALARLMGLAPDASISVKELDDSQLTNDPFNAKVRQLMALAKEKRVDLLASRLGLESAELSYKALKRSNLASISAGVSAGTSDIDVFNTRTGRSQSIGVSVSIPIFTGFTQTYNERAARKGLESQREGLKQAELGVEQDVWNAWHNYQISKTSWDISWDQLAIANQLKDVTLGRYKQGLGTILDVITAQNSYSSALQSHLQSRLSLLTARIDLIRAVGVLDLESVHSDVTIPTEILPDNTATDQPTEPGNP